MEPKGQIPDFWTGSDHLSGKTPWRTGEHFITSPQECNHILPLDDDKTDPDSFVIGLVTGTHPDTYFTDQGVRFKWGALR